MLILILPKHQISLITGLIPCPVRYRHTFSMDRFKDGVQLSNSDKISIKSDGDRYSLTIGNAQESDSGEYKITASSSGGQLSCTASLLVTGKHQQPRSARKW